MSFIRYSVIAAFIAGMLIGAAGLNLVAGKHVDNAELEIERLLEEAAEQAEQIISLEEALSERQKVVVTEIEVHTTFEKDREKDAFSALEIEKNVKNLLKDVRGKEVASLDPLLIRNIIDGRTVEISKHQLVLSVKCLLVSEKLIIYVEVSEVERTVINPENQSTQVQP